MVTGGILATVGFRTVAAANPCWTYSTEAAIPPHVLYLLVRKGVAPALSGVPDGRNYEGNTSITAKIDLFWRFKGTMTSDLSFRAAGPIYCQMPPIGSCSRTSRKRVCCLCRSKPYGSFSLNRGIYNEAAGDIPLRSESVMEKSTS
jgi:hypothetical protein